MSEGCRRRAGSYLEDRPSGRIKAMTEEVSELLKKALALPAEARAALAGSLLDSLDETVDESAEAEWEKEITRRVAELRAHTVKTIPWTEVRRRVLARLNQGG